MEEILPEVNIGGAQSVSAIEAFAASVPEDGKGNLILFSAVDDKDYEKMIDLLCRKVPAEMYVVTHIDDRRGVDAKILGDIFRKYTDRPVIAEPSAKDALSRVLKQQNGRRVYCLGSLYLTGMIKSLIQEVI